MFILRQKLVVCMRQAAETVYEELEDQLVHDAIHGVGYFNDETQEFIHTSGDLNQRYDEAVLANILENAFLDVWGAINQEKMYGSELHATTRVYDEYVDTVIPFGERKGIVFVVDRGAKYQYPNVIKKLEEAVARYDSGIGLES